MKLYVHQVVREDAQLLYGFASKTERELFRQLISVSGVGGNTARMILSTFSPYDLQQIIATENAVLLKNVKGLGLKTAQKIIVELNGKVTPVAQRPGRRSRRRFGRVRGDMAALVMLGSSGRRRTRRSAPYCATIPPPRWSRRCVPRSKGFDILRSVPSACSGIIRQTICRPPAKNESDGNVLYGIFGHALSGRPGGRGGGAGAPHADRTPAQPAAGRTRRVIRMRCTNQSRQLPGCFFYGRRAVSAVSLRVLGAGSCGLSGIFLLLRYKKHMPMT